MITVPAAATSEPRLNDTLHVDSARRPFQWQFAGEAELRRALEEYGTFRLDQRLPGDGGDPDPAKIDRGYRIYCQNMAINRGMMYVGAVSGYAWRLLDMYYRKGYWGEFRGWTKVCAALGLPTPKCQSWARCQRGGDDRYDLPTCGVGARCRWDYESFQVHRELAVSTLFFAIQLRQERTGLDTKGVQVLS